MIDTTNKALSKIHELVSLEKDTYRLRVYIVGGGCSGFKYGFAFEKKLNEDDHCLSFDLEGNKIEVVVDYLSAQYLQGATLDYKNDLTGSGFTVVNPNAKTTCGCGSSFSI